MEWAVYASGQTDAAKNLAMEDALLEGLERGAAAFLTYVDSPCVVIGRNQNPWVEAAPDPALPVFRRRSGGGAVYHDLGNLNWSFLAPRDSWSLEDALDFVRRALAALGLPLERDARGALYQGGRKVGGSARRFFRASVLVHGTLLVSSDLGALDSALGGLEPEGNRAIASVRHPVGNLSEAAPGLAPDDVAAALFRELAARFGAGEAIDPFRALEEGSWAERAREHRSWDWVYGKTMPFRVPLGDGAGSLWIREGRVCEAQGDAGPGGAFLGRPFDLNLLLEVRKAASRRG